MKILQTHIVPENTPKQRLSDYACKIFNLIPSRKGVKKAILRNEILLNGKPTQTGVWVLPGQKLDWIEPHKPQSKVFPLKLDIVFEDDFFAIINKPAGIIVNGNQFRTIENALPYNLKVSKKKDILQRPKAVHRLDGPTSGLLIIAKTAKAHVVLSQQFEKKSIKKKYQAIVIGNIEKSGTLEESIEGKLALTYFEKINSFPSIKNKWLSLVNLFPQTGRTHQLRIHLSNHGYPILGDNLYGKEGLILKHKGLFLCAVELQLIHPISNKSITIKIDPPSKFEKLLKREQRRWEKYFL